MATTGVAPIGANISAFTYDLTLSVSLPGLTGQSSNPCRRRWLLDRPVKPGDDRQSVRRSPQPSKLAPMGVAPIGANLKRFRLGYLFRKMQDRIDRLDAQKPGLQRLSRGKPATRRTEVGLARLRPQNVSKSATADFDAPLTAVAAQAACSASDQCGPASSSDSVSGAPSRLKLAPMGVAPGSPLHCHESTAIACVPIHDKFFRL
jgi:hypothetical protein